MVEAGCKEESSGKLGPVSETGLRKERNLLGDPSSHPNSPEKSEGRGQPEGTGHHSPAVFSKGQHIALLLDAGYTVLVLMSRCKNLILQRLKGRQEEVDYQGWKAPNSRSKAGITPLLGLLT